MWLLVLIVYQLNVVEIDKIHSRTLFIIIGGAILFSIGSASAYLIPKSKSRLEFKNKFSNKNNKKIKSIVLLFLIILMSYIIHSTFKNAAMGNDGAFLERARLAGVENITQKRDILTFFVEHISRWATYAAVLFLLDGRDRYFWIATGIAFVNSIFSTGRTELLLLVAALTGIEIMIANRSKFLLAVKMAKWPAIIFFSLYIGLIFSNKDISTLGSLEGGAAGIALYFLVTYLIGPTAALDYVVMHQPEYINAPMHTFKFLYNLGSKLNLLSYTPPPTLDTFVYIPFPTNVYTVYKFIIVDFGVTSSLVIVGIIGFLQTVLYRRAVTGERFFQYFYALTLFPLVMVIFDDHYYDLWAYISPLIFYLLYYIMIKGVKELHQKVG